MTAIAQLRTVGLSFILAGLREVQDMRRIIIRNTTTALLGVMLEPWTDREDVEAGGELIIEGDFSDDELTIDFSDQNFLSIWAPPGSKLIKVGR